MALSKDYDGPTGGKTVIKADGTTEHVTYYDKPLSKDERAAVEWFDVLSPHEQLREVRRLKWNAEERAKVIEQDKEIIARQDREIMTLRAKLAVFTPAGYTMPSPPALLLAHAESHGWRTARAWTIHEPRSDEPSDEPEYAVLKILLSNGDWRFELSWSVDKGGSGRMIRSGLARRNGRPWFDAPSLIKIQTIITEESENKGS